MRLGLFLGWRGFQMLLSPRLERPEFGLGQAIARVTARLRPSNPTTKS